MCPSLDEWGLIWVPLGMLWKRLRLRTTLRVCRELVPMWGGLPDWDGRPDEIQTEDPIRVFEETMDLGQGSSSWGRYVVYVTWLQEMRGADRACRVLRTLEIRHPETIPSIWILLDRWTASQLCRRNENATAAAAAVAAAPA